MKVGKEGFLLLLLQIFEFLNCERFVSYTVSLFKLAPIFMHYVCFYSSLPKTFFSKYRFVERINACMSGVTFTFAR